MSNIITSYLRKSGRDANGDPVYAVTKRNVSLDANRAVGLCVMHMQINQYSADIAEIYDADDGKLHAQVVRNKAGDIRIAYRRDPAQFETRYSVTHFWDDVEQMLKRKPNE